MHIRVTLSVLNGQADDVPVGVQIDVQVLAQFARLDRGAAELNQRGIRIGEVPDVYGYSSKWRSKKALCTVSPSAKRIPRSARSPVVPNSAIPDGIAASGRLTKGPLLTRMSRHLPCILRV